jgi:hypothetical protein
VNFFGAQLRDLSQRKQLRSNACNVAGRSLAPNLKEGWERTTPVPVLVRLYSATSLGRGSIETVFRHNGTVALGEEERKF